MLWCTLLSQIALVTSKQNILLYIHTAGKETVDTGLFADGPIYSYILRRRRHSPCQNGANVSNEPLCGVEAQDSDSVVRLQTKLWKDKTYVSNYK